MSVTFLTKVHPGSTVLHPIIFYVFVFLIKAKFLMDIRDFTHLEKTSDAP